MSFEEFRRTTYHTRLYIRVPGSNTYVDKSQLMTKGRYDFKKEENVLRKIYNNENYSTR